MGNSQSVETELRAWELLKQIYKDRGGEAYENVVTDYREWVICE